jgi:Zinc knuckle
MHWPHIDQYIIDFEQLVEDTNFDKDHDESIQQFLMGLSHTVLDSVLKATHTNLNPTYCQYRDMAINVTKTEQIFKVLAGGGQAANQFLQNCQFDNRPRQSFQQYTPHNNWYPQRNPNQRYNSSNALRNMNNTAVPMDLDRSRASRQGRPYQSNQSYARLMEVGDPNRPQYQMDRPQTQGPCFNCSQEGHFAHNCTQNNARNEGRNRCPTANLIDLKEGYASPTPSYTSGPSTTNKYDAIQSQIASMSKEEMEELTAQFGAQDF